MITSFKMFENLDYNVGDYILFNYDGESYAHGVRLTDDLIKFLNNNIGEIICISIKELPWIEVRYENIPYNIEKKFYSDGTILLQKKNVVATSNNNADLEIFMQAKKYNL